MKTIYKYPLQIADIQALTLPRNAKILTVQMQGDTPYIWALIDRHAPTDEVVTIRMYGTGHDIIGSEYFTYIGTFQMHSGQLVFHTFYEK